ncbi:FL3-27 [Arabidopsis lyrata subsp. lyrata]|uniref:Cysteine proteinase inhibitor n=1 Tax=Arabidopsis lyrata subsp. lyrata TaxID=81972 RepID=D7LFV4_ARALL|nr:cysteine proteinase inhibitor 3 [Arabidopsis lyrata subsp. lyrata]EFH56155.1 FL3-27 [Arabidopsis lyrata subsp. lyrata]|eukprot:XP_020883151.1 cysteine proteinase inhibitor 3 [Arabidopsis lyrata subsp. lyrata]
MESKTFWIVALLICGTIQLAICRSEEKSTEKTMKLGGVHDLRGNQNSGEIESLARFAIQEHNKQQNKVLEFKKIVKAREQVVSGTMYHLTLEAKEGDHTKNFEAKVWVKPWMNFKQLQEFKESSS